MPEGDVDMMMGPPKAALKAMAIPMVVALLAESLNSFIDAFWLAGLGTSALAAVGVVFPYYFIMVGVGNGIGTGAAQAIARRIGAGDRDGADRVASQAFFLTLASSIVLGVVFVSLCEPLMVAAGAGDYLDECIAYAMPIFVGTPVALFSFMFSGLLRSEGAARRSMGIQMAAAALNMALDPLLIYGMGMGVTGAAVATMVAVGIPMALPLYWYFIKRDTYVGIRLRGFRFDASLDWDIMRVGAPASLEMVVMSFMSILMNQIILSVDPVNGVAVYSTGWRILNVLMIPQMALGYALVPICAAAYGASDNGRLRDVIFVSLKYGFITMIAISAVTLFAAPLMVHAFTYAGSAASLAEEMTRFVRVGCVFLPFLVLSFVSAGLFQSLGMGMKSLLSTLFLNFVRIPICLALSLLGTLSAIWWGVASSEILAAVFIGAWGMYVLKGLMAGKYPLPDASSC